MWNKIKDTLMLWVVISIAFWPEIFVVLSAVAFGGAFALWSAVN